MVTSDWFSSSFCSSSFSWTNSDISLADFLLSFPALLGESDCADKSTDSSSLLASGDVGSLLLRVAYGEAGL